MSNEAPAPNIYLGPEQLKLAQWVIERAKQIGIDPDEYAKMILDSIKEKICAS